MASAELLSPREIRKMHDAGRAAAATLARVLSELGPGTSTHAIDRLVREDTAARGGRPSQLGYHGFPAAVCTSRNQVVCHGIPSKNEILQDGDIVNVDVTTELLGFHGDTSATAFVGTPSPEARHVVDAAEACLRAGLSVVREGARLGDVGAAIEEVARRLGCSVVDPHVSHVGTRGTGLRLRAGMAFTIEPMVNLGTERVRVLDDGWTVVTLDGSLSAQFEHTLIVTREGYELTTLLPEARRARGGSSA